MDKAIVSAAKDGQILTSLRASDRLATIRRSLLPMAAIILACWLIFGGSNNSRNGVGGVGLLTIPTANYYSTLSEAVGGGGAGPPMKESLSTLRDSTNSSSSTSTNYNSKGRRHATNAKDTMPNNGTESTSTLSSTSADSNRDKMMNKGRGRDDRRLSSLDLLLMRSSSSTPRGTAGEEGSPSLILTDFRHPCHQYKLKRSLDATYVPYPEMKSEILLSRTKKAGKEAQDGDAAKRSTARESDEQMRAEGRGEEDRHGVHAPSATDRNNRNHQYTRWRLPLCMMPALHTPRPVGAELWLERVKGIVYVDEELEAKKKSSHFGFDNSRKEGQVGATAHAIRSRNPEGLDMPTYLLEYPYSMSFFRPPLYQHYRTDSYSSTDGENDCAAENHREMLWHGNYFLSSPQKQKEQKENEKSLFDGSISQRDLFVHYDRDEWDAYCHLASSNSVADGSPPPRGGGKGGSVENASPLPLINNIVIPDKVVFLFASAASGWEVDSIMSTTIPPVFKSRYSRPDVHRQTSTGFGVETLLGDLLGGRGGAVGSQTGENKEDNNKEKERARDGSQEPNRRDRRGGEGRRERERDPIVFAFHLTFDTKADSLFSSVADLSTTLSCLREHLLMWYNVSVVDSVFFGSSADFIRNSDVPSALKRYFPSFSTGNDAITGRSTGSEVTRKRNMNGGGSDSDNVVVNTLLPKRHILPHINDYKTDSTSNYSRDASPPPLHYHHQYFPHAVVYINEAITPWQRVKTVLDVLEATRLGVLEALAGDTSAETTYRKIVGEKRRTAAAWRRHKRRREISGGGEMGEYEEALSPLSPLSTANIDMRGFGFLSRSTAASSIAAHRESENNNNKHKNKNSKSKIVNTIQNPLKKKRTKLSVFIDGEGMIDLDKEDAYVERQNKLYMAHIARSNRRARMLETEELIFDIRGLPFSKPPMVSYHIVNGAYEHDYYFLHSNETEPSSEADGGRVPYMLSKAPRMPANHNHIINTKKDEEGLETAVEAPSSSSSLDYDSYFSSSSPLYCPPTPLPPPPAHHFSRLRLAPTSWRLPPLSFVPEVLVVVMHSDEFGYRRNTAKTVLEWKRAGESVGVGEKRYAEWSVDSLHSIGGVAIALPSQQAGEPAGDDPAFESFRNAYEVCLQMANCLVLSPTTTATTRSTRTTANTTFHSVLITTVGADKATVRDDYERSMDGRAPPPPPPPHRRRAYLRHYSPDRFAEKLSTADRREVEHVMVGYKHFRAGLMTPERVLLGGKRKRERRANNNNYFLNNESNIKYREETRHSSNGPSEKQGPPPALRADSGVSSRANDESSSTGRRKRAATHPTYPSIAGGGSSYSSCYLKGRRGSDELVTRDSTSFLDREFLWSFIGFIKTDRVALVEAMRRLTRKKRTNSKSEESSIRYMWGALDKISQIIEGGEGDGEAEKPDPALEAHFYTRRQNKNSTGFIYNRTKYAHSCCQGHSPEETYGRSIFVPVGRGFDTLDCFRIYEAAAAGAIPIIVGPVKEIVDTFGGFAAGGPFSDAKTDWEWMRFGFTGHSPSSSSSLSNDDVSNNTNNYENGSNKEDANKSEFLATLPPFLYAETWENAARVVKALLASEEAVRTNAQEEGSSASSSFSSSILYRYHLRVTEWFMRHYRHTQNRLIWGGG